MLLRAHCEMCKKLNPLPVQQEMEVESQPSYKIHAVACLLWDMQLAPYLSTPPPPTKQRVPPLVVTKKLEDMQLRP
jgi:hypothetical protein